MNVGDKVAKLCLEWYERLGKKGKPEKGKEWTQLAGIVVEIDNKFRVLSLATGTKCIGVNFMCPKGTILNDSHAEGALLSHFIDGDLKLSSLVIGAGGPYNENIIKHSLIGRTGLEGDFPQIIQSNLVFGDSPFKILGGKPAPASIIWSNVLDKSLDVSSRGRRLGTTTKAVDKGVVVVAKVEFLKQFFSLCPENCEKMTYREIKEKALNYQLLCKYFKQRMGNWSQKPALESFTLYFNNKNEKA